MFQSDGKFSGRTHGSSHSAFRRAFSTGRTPRVALPRGFTMVEVLVSITILGLLLAVIIPAVQAARESSHRSQCASQLREIGVALQSYEAAHKTFPAIDFHYPLLPHLGQQNIFNLVPAENWSADGILPTWELLPADPIATYVCPSDGAAQSAHVTNYMSNYGSGYMAPKEDGVFRLGKGVRMTEISDGLSNTAAVAESLGSTPGGGRLRVVWSVVPGVVDLATLPDRCERLPIDPGHRGYRAVLARGIPWFAAMLHQIQYNHLLPPNRPSCINDLAPATSVLTATSAHRSGVNLLYADGHVKFESELTDRNVWREIGSRGLVGSPL